MARPRRRALTWPEPAPPWPSFVDVMSNMLVILVFVITLLSIRSGRMLEAIAERAAASDAEALLAQEVALLVETPGVAVEREGAEVRVRLQESVLFDSGSASVKADGQGILVALARRLASLPGRIEVQGHTDDAPIAGALTQRYPTNWELSTARATAVVRLLQEEAQIPPGRLSGTGFGEHRPIASNATDEGRAQNRRIELVVRPEEPGGDGAPP